MIKKGVATGDQVQEIFKHAKKNGYALPAVNVVNTSTVNAVLEEARDTNAPAMVQFSAGGCQFFAGKGLSNDNYQAAIAGGISGAMHTHQLAELYGATVILHTDHCAKKLLPWIDGLLDASEDFHKVHGKSLYSSHMIDLSEESLEENIDICKRYLDRMSKMDMTLEIELGITGGEEDGVDNSDVDSSKLYTQPDEVAYAYEELMKVSDVDGCQIRLDGEVRRIEGEWCEVLVRMEGKRGFLIQPMIMALTTRLRNVELTERVHVWNQLNAKSIDRVRRTGSNECEFWAPL